MKKRRRTRRRDFLLLDKSVLQSLIPEQRKELDSKHRILYPPILFHEIARHGLSKPSALFDLENTVWVRHWIQHAKMDLVEGSSSPRYEISAQSIYGESEASRKDMEKQAKRIVQEMKAAEEQLKNHISPLRNFETKFWQLVRNHRDIPDENLVREFNQVTLQQAPLISRASLIGKSRKSVSQIRRILDESQSDWEELHSVNTLEKAYEWVSQVIYRDTESILGFLCKAPFMPLSNEERTAILNRFERQEKPDIDMFAPYARRATQLYLTIFLYFVENGENSSPRGALRDSEYLYYALDDNVTFVSADHWHKKCIEEIPLLEDVRKRWVYLVQKNKSQKDWEKGLRSIGVTV